MTQPRAWGPTATGLAGVGDRTCHFQGAIQARASESPPLGPVGTLQCNWCPRQGPGRLTHSSPSPWLGKGSVLLKAHEWRGTRETPLPQDSWSPSWVGERVQALILGHIWMLPWGKLCGRQGSREGGSQARQRAPENRSTLSYQLGRRAWPALAVLGQAGPPAPLLLARQVESLGLPLLQPAALWEECLQPD